VQGARAVMQQRTKQFSGLSRWLAQLTSRTHRNVAGVVLGGRLKIDFLRAAPTREFIHLGLSGTAGVV